jgi:hypothetical protein
MVFIFIVASILAAIFYIGKIGPYIAAQDAIKKYLHDPDSAKFSGMFQGVNKGDACGYVNAKNRMGGYVGSSPFIYRADINQAKIVNPPDKSDFRSLWLNIKLKQSWDEKFLEFSDRCKTVDYWEKICGKPSPVSLPKLCNDMLNGSGGEFLNALKSAVGE